MIENYAFYYSYKGTGDVLVIIIDGNAKVTKTIKNKNVVATYNGDRIIGYNIFDISKIVKIKSNGLIPLPSKTIIDIINSILVNAKLDKLPYKKESGYIIGKIVDMTKENEGYNYKVDISKEIVDVKSHYELKINDYVAIAKPGTYLVSGALLDCYYICNEKELGISDSYEVLILEDEVKVGGDFYKMEVK